MKEKKNIDRLFQEQLKDFESAPDNQVWLNIESELRKDKKRKVIALWMKCTGIAAAFLIGLFALNMNQTFHSKTEKRIVLDTKSSKKSLNKKQIYNQNNTKEIQIVSISKKSSKYKKEIIHNNFSNSTAKDEKEISPYRSSNALVLKKKNQNNTGIFLSKNNLPIKSTSTNESAKNSVQTDLNPFVAIQQLVEKMNPKEEEIIQKKQAINQELPNELEEILKTKSASQNAVVTNSKNKWQIAPNIGQVYLNTNSGGSPIDKQLSNYDKKSDKSLSYGIGVRYALNNKLAFRTGINKVVLGYNTNNVLYSASLTANNLKNVEYSADNAVKIVSQANYSSFPTLEKEIQSTNTGTLNQKMGYYELPIEVSYAVLDKKFGINLIGGFSTLFLNENTISLVSSQSNIELGEAKNLNQVHFSTNFGLGFKYQLIKSFQLNFEPVVKYQFNTFSKDGNNFSPIYIGLYSGISYQF